MRIALICSLNSIAARRVQLDLEVMRSFVQTRDTQPDADNELFDRGCDLVQAAADIRHAAESPQAIRAVPAVLGCMESALEELLWASAVLEETTGQVHVDPHGTSADSRVTRQAVLMHQGYANLQQALADAQRASAAARGLARRWLSGGPAHARLLRDTRDRHDA